MTELKKGKIVVHCPKCGKVYDMDEYNKLEKVNPSADAEVYDARICPVCNTEFGFVRIAGKDKENTIFEIGMDLIEPKEELIAVDKERLDKLINATQLAFAELLDSELYQPMKLELAQHNITHSLGIKKEMFKNKVECLFKNLEKDILELDESA